jgi:hypothetical protein
MPQARRRCLCLSGPLPVLLHHSLPVLLHHSLRCLPLPWQMQN